MFSWRVLAVLSMFASTPGCAVDSVPSAFVSRVTPGLSNVPWISGSTATNDERIPDVVSNGPDACGRDLRHGRLWSQWPPCPAVEPTAWQTSRVQRPPVSTVSSSQELNQPWLEFIDFDWPCSRGRADGGQAVVACR